jgi:hypothetical protein
VRWSGEEGRWLPEEALPFCGGGVATPTFGPTRVSNARTRTKRTRLSRENWARPGGGRRFYIWPTRARRRRWMNSRWCALHASIQILHPNPSTMVEINNISKSYCCSWRSVGLRKTGGVRHTKGTAPTQGLLCVQRRGTRRAKPIVLLGKS